MRAMLLKEQQSITNNPLHLEDVPKPEPGPGEVRIKVNACGVCHTDLHEIEGDLELPELPLIPGHQIVGVIDDLGEGVADWAPGTRVGVPWLYSTCQECEFCKKGLENLCENAKFTGKDVNGGYAEYVIAPADFIYSIPEGFPDMQAAPLLCAGIIGYRALRLTNIEPGQNVGLYGFGASAHVTIQVAIHWGCDVYVFTRSEDHRRHAKDLGAVWTGSSKDDPGALMDGSIIFAPAGEIVVDALRVLRRGGTVTSAGIHMSNIPEFEYDLIYGERTIQTVANSTRKDARELLQLAAEIPIRTDIEAYSLENANKVLNLIKESRIRGAAVLKISDE
ncbi:MAG: zinc-dependent alcohol dehydrogenase family protein [Candidatus Marinimicrobia bacterium]|nr:zinc-dependent alcohol dehydrogenase family protein [Candidatus Neomarinimicrobiota bacterium]MCF7828348.1 zinc-dependent alcohol dehydrogenase family protein [Candidatus Neomarinimicrobiota bacterium]MCF7881059.1 zinc-dependent alcohol dehydrogenase family protein [Candidatus Neomarinimicrobiota bacterium]